MLRVATNRDRKLILKLCSVLDTDVVSEISDTVDIYFENVVLQQDGRGTSALIVFPGSEFCTLLLVSDMQPACTSSDLIEMLRFLSNIYDKEIYYVRLLLPNLKTIDSSCLKDLQKRSAVLLKHYAHLDISNVETKKFPNIRRANAFDLLGVEYLISRLTKLMREQNEELFRVEDFEFKFVQKASSSLEFTVVAVDDHKIIGFAACSNTVMNKGYGELAGIYVMPSYRNKGIGTSLVEAAFQNMKKHGAHTASWNLYNTPAHMPKCLLKAPLKFSLLDLSSCRVEKPIKESAQTNYFM